MSRYFNELEQKDLFENTSQGSPLPKKQKINFLSHHKVSLRLDQLLICSIVVLCLGVSLFCVGVEKGKRFALEEIKAERIKHQRIVKELGAKLFSKSNNEAIKAKEASEKPSQKAQAPVKIEEAVSPSAKKAVPPKIEIVDAAKKSQFTIQMVTYKTEQAAHKLIQKMTSKGHKTYLIPSGKYIQVCLEAFESRSVASRTLRKLKADGVVPADAYVRSLPR